MGKWDGAQWTILTNIGTMQNVGWELMFKGVRHQDKRFPLGFESGCIIYKEQTDKIA